ncbi:hypothetical protein [Clostridium kluyveri]|uniref:Uncharacterized protein n=1 Tax=Clostridium kluyveri (strain ATCC 8527 / DSM 555 / NBRC 12016 / NCIMB 10680 / K1) TaxID=431943 RepID=A5F9P5_CLOK5|nr:hypothetical protein [Clostridium kluyveri]ABQ23618.1 hypothetical protein CKL_4019 [Clostridium kluyveri DSM 555]
MSKLFKFWRWRLEIKLSKLPDQKRVEILANKLIEELNIQVDNECHNVNLWVHDKEQLTIDSSSNKELNYIFKGKYTGK